MLDSLNSLRVDGYLDGRASLAWLSPSLQAAGVIMDSMDFFFLRLGGNQIFSIATSVPKHFFFAIVTHTSIMNLI